MAKKHIKETQHKTKDEEVAFDFSGIKNLFSSKHKKHHEPAEGNEEATKADSQEEGLTLDFGSAMKILSKYSYIVLIIIALGLSIYIRTLPAGMPVAEDWARQGIYNNIQNNIAAQIMQQYPNLDPQNAQNLVSQQFNTFVSQQSVLIEQAVKQQAAAIKLAFTDKTNHTYLGDIDSYYWMRYAQNIINTGQIGDEVRQGVPYDNHMLAPLGFKIDVNIYPYIEAYLFKFLRIFNPSITLMQTAFYTPLFLSFFAIIAAFFIGKKLAGNVAGFIAAVMIAVNPTVLSRSLGSDNDIVNAVFPLVIMLFAFYAFDAKNKKQLIIYSLFTGLLTGIYSFAWSGWWFMFLFIIGSGITYVGYLVIFHLVNKKENTEGFFKSIFIINTLLFLGIFIVSTFIGLALFGKETGIIDAFFNPFRIINLQAASKGASLWPNIYTTVAELNPGNIPEVVSSLGGQFFFWIALVGALLSLVNFKSDNKRTVMINTAYLIFSAIYLFAFVNLAATNSGNFDLIFLIVMVSIPFVIGLFLSIIFRYKIDPKHSILMVIWFMATMYAATKGVRFILLIIPAFVVSFGMFFGFMVDILSRLLERSLDINKMISRSIFAILALLILITPIRAGYQTAYNYVPSVNNAWVDTLSRININSQKTAIINSWWDFGHWFKYFSDRAVTFDGASQNKAQAHWIGKVLLTDNEHQAISILRMLDCGSNNAFNYLNANLNDTHESVNLIYSMFNMTSSQAKTQLLKITTPENADQIISSMYCQPPEDYFITSQDMVGKSGVWAHFGSWDFQKAEIYSYFKTMTYDEFISALATQYNYTADTAQKIYYEINSFTTDQEVNNWIAPWPSYVMNGMVGCDSNNSSDTIVCSYGVKVGETSQYAVVAERAQINLTTGSSALILGYYDATTNKKTGDSQVIPNAVVTYSKGNFNETGAKAATFSQNLLVWKMNDGTYRSTIVVPELTRSLFTRLFYLEGDSMQGFTKVYDTTDITGGRIITWKVVWPNITGP